MNLSFIFWSVLVPLLRMILILGVALFFFNLFLPFFGAMPYVPTPMKHVKKMLEMADLKPGETLVDLGCGDGRILIEAARKGALAIGYEIDPLQVYSTRRKIKELGLEKKIKIYRQSCWQADVSSADVITVYGITGVMKRIERKLLKESKIGARICSYIFSFPQWDLEKKESGIYFYKKS